MIDYVPCHHVATLQDAHGDHDSSHPPAVWFTGSDGRFGFPYADARVHVTGVVPHLFGGLIGFVPEPSSFYFY